MPYRLQNPKWPTGSGKFFGQSKQLSQNKFFHLSTPSRGKVDNGEEEKMGGGEKKIMSFIVATNVVASRPTGTPHARANL